ncbi:MAG: hypothetical protein UHX00_07825 [Caryophanon sp.]|nr:hypothetical protein [Caryophanon sp.]
MSNGWEFALLDYMTTVEGQQYGVTGSIKFDYMSIDLDFNKRKLTNGPHAVTLNAAMVASVSIGPKVAVPLKKGQNVHFILENFGSIERILLDETVYTIIPAYYEWDLAYNYYFKYSN